jgi:hypothetical protein
MENGQRLGLLSQESGVSPSGGLLTKTRLVGLRWRKKLPDGSYGEYMDYADESTPDIDEGTPDVQEDPKNIGREDYFKKETHRTKLPVRRLGELQNQIVEAMNPNTDIGQWQDIRTLMPENQPRDYGMQHFFGGENYPMPQFEPDPSLRNEESERGHVYGGLGKPPKPLTFEEDKLADELEQGLIKEKHKSLISPSDLERLAVGEKWNANYRKIRAKERIEELLKTPEQY